jgi:hypothetical protein
MREVKWQYLALTIIVYNKVIPRIRFTIRADHPIYDFYLDMLL